MVLQTLRTIGPQHGYGIARRIEQVSGDLIAMNQGTLYPALVRLEQDGLIKSKWGVSENNRKAKFYALTKRGEKGLATETERWSKVASVIERFLKDGARGRRAMMTFRRAITRLRESFRSGAIDRDLSAEIDSHLDHLTDEYVRSGLDRDEARRRAVLAFGGAGGVESAREAVRDMRGLPLSNRRESISGAPSDRCASRQDSH